MSLCLGGSRFLPDCLVATNTVTPIACRASSVSGDAVIAICGIPMPPKKRVLQREQCVKFLDTVCEPIFDRESSCQSCNPLSSMFLLSVLTPDSKELKSDVSAHHRDLARSRCTQLRQRRIIAILTQ